MKRKGFTLVELLVVIAIIALLLSMLMPALGKARENAKAVVCMSNVKQIALCYGMYTNDNKGFFNIGYTTMQTPGEVLKLWPEFLQPYYAKTDNLRCCPSAPGPRDKNAAENARGDYRYGSDVSGTKYWLFPKNISRITRPFYYGSYTTNDWITNPDSSLTSIPGWGVKDTSWMWRKSDQSGSNNIPLIADGYWPGGFPDNGDVPPMTAGTAQTAGTSQMNRFCTIRHVGKVNVAFIDGTARSVGLWKLWSLKWHRTYDTTQEPECTTAKWLLKYKK